MFFIHFQRNRIIFQMWKFVNNQNSTYLRAIYFAVIPGAIQTHDMICMAMAQEKAVLRKVITHELEVVNSNVRVVNVRHSISSI
jgi:hypothetical protein